MQLLTRDTLAQAPSGKPVPAIKLPGNAQSKLPPGVVHLGLGAFHRAHQAVVFDQLIAQGDTRWGVLGVAMRSTELSDALIAQDGLYSVQVASREGREWQVIGAIVESCVAAREPEQVVAALAAPDTRWVTLTVTEKGYGLPLAQLLVDGLQARRQAGLGGLTIASCDNLSDNGHKLRQLCLNTALAADATLAEWIASTCAFPNSMVDRIVPAATPQHQQDAEKVLGLADHCALGTEQFWEWVIERQFVDPADADTLASAGVQVVEDVRPFEEAKLRMLNGSHTAIAMIGAVAGLPTVADCIGQPLVREYIHALMTGVFMPQLKRPGLPAYRDALLARFANPDLKHQVHQIATDSSLKIPFRWKATIETALQYGASVEALAFATAAWMRYLQAGDEQGQTYAISDPLSDRLQATARQHRGDVAATVAALLSETSIWGQVLPASALWNERVCFWLAAIHELDVLGALARYLQTPQSSPAA